MVRPPIVKQPQQSNHHSSVTRKSKFSFFFFEKVLCLLAIFCSVTKSVLKGSSHVGDCRFSKTTHFSNFQFTVSSPVAQNLFGIETRAGVVFDASTHQFQL